MCRNTQSSERIVHERNTLAAFGQQQDAHDKRASDCAHEFRREDPAERKRESACTKRVNERRDQEYACEEATGDIVGSAEKTRSKGENSQADENQTYKKADHKKQEHNDDNAETQVTSQEEIQEAQGDKQIRGWQTDAQSELDQPKEESVEPSKAEDTHQDHQEN